MWAASQPWILAGEQSSLLTRIAATESVSLCAQKKVDGVSAIGIHVLAADFSRMKIGRG